MAWKGYWLATLLVLNSCLLPVQGGLLFENNPIDQIVQIIFEPSGLVRLAYAADVIKYIVIGWRKIIPRILMLPYLSAVGKLRRRKRALPFLKNPDMLVRLEKIVDFLNKASEHLDELLRVSDGEEDDETVPLLGT